MRTTALLLAAILALSPTLGAAATDMPDDPKFQFEYLAAFYVANENCVGQHYVKGALGGHMYRLGMEMGWSEQKINAEMEAETLRAARSFAEDGENFCIAIASARHTSEDYLRELEIIR